MRIAFTFCFMALGVMTGPSHATETYFFQVTEPSFTVTLPSLPQMKMEVHPMHDIEPYLRFIGSEGAYTVSILTPTADASMTAQECASSILGSLDSRPGVPEQSKIYLIKINELTFAGIYASPKSGFLQLNAHFVSSVKKHCIEVHASKVPESKDDIARWFKGFDKANIEVN